MVSYDTTKSSIIDNLYNLDWNANSIKRDYFIKLSTTDLLISFLLLDKNGESLGIIHEINEKGYSLKETKKNLLEAARMLEINYIFFSYQNTILLWECFADDARKVSNFYSQDDLERKRRIYSGNENRLTNWNISNSQTDLLRKYQVDAVNIVEKKINNGSRRISLNIATGAGKNTILLNIIKNLVNLNLAEKILILAENVVEAERIIKSISNIYLDVVLFLSDYQENINHLKSKPVIVSTLQSFSRNYTKFSIGNFDYIILPENRQLTNGNYIEEIRQFDSKIIDFSSIPNNILLNQVNGKLASEFFKSPDFLFDLHSAIQEGYLSSHQTIYLNDKIKNQLGKHRDKKVTENTIIHMVEIIDNRTRLKNLFSPSDEKTIIYSSSKYHAVLIADLLNKRHPENYGNYAKFITADLPVHEVNEIIDQFKTQVFPIFLVNVNLLTTGIDFDNIKNIFICRDINNPVEYYQIIGRGLRQRNQKSINIFDFFDNEKQYYKINDPKNTSNKSNIMISDELAEIFEKWRKSENTNIKKNERIEYGFKGASLSKQKYIKKWESILTAYIREKKIKIPQTKMELNTFYNKNPDLETYINQSSYFFNEENLRLAYGNKKKTLNDFIWMAINQDKRKIEIEDINESFEKWMNLNDFTLSQRMYLSILKNYIINKNENNVDRIKSDSTNSFLNVYGLGEILFEKDQIDKLLKEFNVNVFDTNNHFYE
jgi:type I restriction enzyme, R subunit